MPIPTLSVIDQMAASLSVSSLQNQVIAGNIANRDTQGYQRIKLSFDSAMESAATITADGSSEPVSLEQDLVALSANAAHYETMAKALSRYFSMLSAITNYSRG